ncbi:hypothetical protein ALC57_18966 [Trachymyrmex cornetzi]|uniref:Uncharacterized protein n=1 Tax=Trachymyrmex cornetzi TaxID=471704 RepID=A0A195D9C2_9HYME|nr:hypothetical protein ALC57_18966 [Trachymyrmex cornetzi]
MAQLFVPNSKILSLQATFYKFHRKLRRPSAGKLIEHRWLEAALENPIQKHRLKRYVIKKRWVKAVNTILALKRMGARLDFDLV